MPNFVEQFGLSESEFERGLERSERAAAASAERAYELALRSAIKSGEESGRGRRQVPELRRELEGLRAHIAQDVKDRGIVQAATSVLKGLRAARREAEQLASKEGGVQRAKRPGVNVLRRVFHRGRGG